VPQDLDNAIITNSFSVYDLDNKIINSNYLHLITKTKYFQALCEKESSGTTGRRNISDEHFINFKIPLPSKFEQERIVKNYYAKINQANYLEQEAANLSAQSEDYFLAELGIEKTKPRERKKGLQFVEFKDLERWDVFSTDVRITQELKKAKFKLVSIGVFY